METRAEREILAAGIVSVSAFRKLTSARKRARFLAAACLSSCLCNEPASRADTGVPSDSAERRESVEDLLTRGQTVTGAEYLQVELDARQRAAGDDVQKAALRRATADVDPVKALMAHVVLAWVSGAEPDYGGALEYLVGIPIRMAPTVAGFPSPTSVASYLTRKYAKRVAPLLALRLVKEGGWPRWKAGGTLFYLEADPDPTTTSAVIRFAIEVTDPALRGYAIETLQTYEDPNFGKKLKYEITRANALKLPIPPEVRALGSRG
jgi:hypothetical protein